MPAPRTPAAVDGTDLDTEARAMLTKILGLVWAADTTRRPESITQQALGAFRLMFQRVDGAWTRRPQVQLGDDEGGAIIRIPTAFPAGEA